MARVSLEQLQSALLRQHQIFEQQQVPDRIRRTYRSALKLLLAWCQQQEWFSAAMEGEQKLLLPPKRSKRSAQELHVHKKNVNEDEPGIQSYRYGLGAVEGDFINEKLQKELDDFIEFRTNPPLQGFRPVKASTLERELAGIRLILGWLHRNQARPMEDLSLTHIVPLVPLNASDKQASTEAIVDGIMEAYSYINWLKAEPIQGGRGLKTQQVDLSNLKIFRSVAMFIYHQQIPPDKQSQPKQWLEEIPIIRSFNKVIRGLQAHVSNKAKLSDQTPLAKTISTWSEVLVFVEKLRSECVPNLPIARQTRKQPVSLGPSRSLSAIAQCYQRFLLCALMSYMPPQPQQEYRSLVIDQNHCLNLEECSGYLYKKDDRWYMTILDRKQSLTNRHREYHSEIPNIEYTDGRYFYQYLQEWLYEYTYVDTEGQERKTNGLRAALQPQHAYLFMKKSGEKYKNPTELSRLIRDAAYRLTGKTINPLRFRHLFIGYVSEKMSEQTELESFAKLLGHSSEANLKNYQKLLQQPETAQVANRAAANIAQVLSSMVH